MNGGNNLNFKDFELGTNLIKAITEMGFTEPSDIQQQAIPVLMEETRDFVGQAQTGTGKTAAFGLPLLQHIGGYKGKVKALVLAPTRELANQVCTEIDKLAKFTDVKTLPIYGGTSYDKQKLGLKRKKPGIVVGTPGRVIDLIKQKVLDLSELDYVVLDEADEMLNMGFFEDVQTILGGIKQEKRMWMFSATMPAPILKLINKDFKNPSIVKIKKETLSNASIEQLYYVVKKRNFNEALGRLLKVEEKFYGIIFCRTRMETKELADYLLREGHFVETLHGELGQAQRDLAMSRFKSRKTKIMVCTDVAARGIDVTDLTHVINYGLPQDCESYVHRIGRTGRAGSKGIAITLADPREKSRLGRIEKLTKSKIELRKLPTVKDLKRGMVVSEIEKMSNIANVLFEKGHDFKLDKNFELFQEGFGPLPKEDVLKVLFTYAFNKDLKRLDEMGAIDDQNLMKQERSRGRDKNRGGRDRGERRGGPRVTKAGHVRLFMNMGKDDGLNLMSLLDDLSTQSKCQKRMISNVDMKGKFSFLEVPAKYGDVFLRNKMKVKNRSVRFEISN
jgi:ATP-dependent RNA helicase DeaD